MDYAICCKVCSVNGGCGFQCTDTVEGCGHYQGLETIPWRGAGTRMKHALKIKDAYLCHLIDGTKKCEIRLNDRDYQIGDILAFDIHNPENEKDFIVSSTKYIAFKIVHIHSGLGMKENYVCLSVEKVEDDNPELLADKE